MNQYPFENLSDDEFEQLVIRISNELFGIGCKSFSIGPDGAKDSWFNGKATKFPSESAPWEGIFILQAKHTLKINASCSDPDFESPTNQSSVITKEIRRLKEIRSNDPFDNYVIFTNRKLPGAIHTPIRTRLQNELGIENVEIVGREDLNNYLTHYPHIADKFGLYRFVSPLRFYEKDLREIIIFFSENIQTISTEASDFVKSYTIVDKEVKNQLNDLSKEYFEFIKTHSLQYFESIDAFF